MAAVRALRVSVRSDSGSDHSESDSDCESDRDARDAEPMEVEEGEVEVEDIPVNRSLRELLPDTSRRYENKAGTFITGIDVTSKEAIEKKEKRAKRFHFCAEVSVAQRNVMLDKEILKKAIPTLRLEALYVAGVDDMSTQEVFEYFKQYPPAHIEWIDDTSCNVVWLDDVTTTRALINLSRMPDPETVTTETDGTKMSGPTAEESKTRKNQSSDEDEEEGEVDDDDDDDDEEEEEETAKKKNNEGEVPGAEGDTGKKTEAEIPQVDLLSQAETDSLLRNDSRPVTKPFKGNKLFLRFATHDDKKELGAARRSRYYMKYGNPNYGGMRGILSNSWKRRYHTRRIQRDVIKTKKPLIGDSMGHTPPYTHRHSADLVNLPEEPIEEEEEEEEEEEQQEEDMDSDDRVVEYKEKGERERSISSRLGLPGAPRSRPGRPRSSSPSSSSSDSSEMDYDLELKMISTPSPKKSMKMTMYADEVETNLKSIRHTTRGDSSSGGSGVRNRIGGGGGTKAVAEKVTDVRQLLEEKKRQGLSQQHPPVAAGGKTDVRLRLGKRRYSPERRRSTSPVLPRDTPPPRDTVTDVHSRLGVAKQDDRSQPSDSSKDRKSGGLWSRLGPTARDDARQSRPSSGRPGSLSSRVGSRKRPDGEEAAEEEKAEEEEDDSALQKVWGAMIKQKEQQTHKLKKSRLDNLPSLQIEISRESSNESDSDS